MTRYVMMHRIHEIVDDIKYSFEDKFNRTQGVFRLWTYITRLEKYRGMISGVVGQWQKRNDTHKNID